MALARMTLEEIKAGAAARTPDEEAAFRRRMDETREEDIRRHMIEDGEDPDAEPWFAAPVLAQDVAALRARALASLADPAPNSSEAEADARLGAVFGAISVSRVSDAMPVVVDTSLLGKLAVPQGRISATALEGGTP